MRKNTITPELLKAIVPTMPLARRRQYAPLINDSCVEFGVANEARVAAYVAQLAHESDGFNTLVEYASGKAYEGRRDLGNTQPGDGKRYKGRGAIQLTGRANYRTVGRALGLDLEGRPELAAEPANAFRIAGHYWRSRGLNELADARRFKEITRRINGGYNGLADRVSYYERALAALPDDFRLTDDAEAPDAEAEPDVTSASARDAAEGGAILTATVGEVAATPPAVVVTTAPAEAPKPPPSPEPVKLEQLVASRLGSVKRSLVALGFGTTGVGAFLLNGLGWLQTHPAVVLFVVKACAVALVIYLVYLLALRVIREVTTYKLNRLQAELAADTSKNTVTLVPQVVPKPAPGDEPALTPDGGRE